MNSYLEERIQAEISKPNFDTNKILNIMREIYYNGELQISQVLYSNLMDKASENCQVALNIRQNLGDDRYDKTLLQHMICEDNVGYLKRWLDDISSSMEYICDESINKKLIDIISDNRNFTNYRIDDRYDILISYLRDGHESDELHSKKLFHNILNFTKYFGYDQNKMIKLKIAYLNSSYFNDNYFYLPGLPYNSRTEFYSDLPPDYQLGIIL